MVDSISSLMYASPSGGEPKAVDESHLWSHHSPVVPSEMSQSPIPWEGDIPRTYLTTFDQSGLLRTQRVLAKALGEIDLLRRSGKLLESAIEMLRLEHNAREEELGVALEALQAKEEELLAAQTVYADLLQKVNAYTEDV